MKKQQIVDELTRIVALDKAAQIKPEIQALIDQLNASTEPDKGKLTYYVEVGERKMDPAKKYPRQMIAVHDILVKAGLPKLTLDEIKALMGEHAAELQTKQDPMRIYAFYQKPMADEGWIARSTERV